MKKACLYIRVSTDEQADKGFSQRDQAERLQTYCLRNHIEVTKIIFEDYSAKTFNRPEWNKLLAEMKRSKGKDFDYIMFTKWDRFSRNTADAYQMIRILNLDYFVEPVAIEQPLDVEVPESKTILAVYLSMPEVENDRRALNVKYGMRRAKKEGRWMGRAPAGYKNKTTEDGKKYIAIYEPEASYMKWAFEQLAEGTFATEHVWMKAKEMGLKCGRSSFWDYIRNPGYCGKIRIPAFKDEEARLVDGQHEPLISESLFYKVQDVLEGRKRQFKQKQGNKAVSPRSLALRGFLICPKCGEVLTGSASRGRKHYYHYYHCKAGCPRFRADMTNILFERVLKQFVPRPGMAELFISVVSDAYFENRASKADRSRTIEIIKEQNNRMNKSIELLINDVISGTEYQNIKKDCEEKIERAKAALQELTERDSEELDIENLATLATSNLKKLTQFYSEADSDVKRSITGSIFLEKWVFDGENHRTTKMNKAAQLIYHINKKLRHKKTGANFLEKIDSGKVHL
ncbi:Site-specific DNA recombinase [Pedobacter steynii]|uniref:Site-specific DNA recombinase n=1 Tax=Pedobacter steynii TaxID=430522 RepID=A0A1H0G8G3_9SPHI|nr:recombinase family protein [Pedobacter steynii]NQX42352.1 recombinase family protein [Pedobacter steynii]SDO03187.1 Site-specific DNA recombinase [Pedobacter steynii]